ncbi:unnamed protein product [Miscanthus lutarioriparius]|uniref:non-specific serine/threonine protein kinase n=1 Tax=Miscanthus lutarioriparius TaxID=422564 RepID=A0A811NSD9_9POAL|nr:unnamed protein product [Miscanthus lutarioriparius]
MDGRRTILMGRYEIGKQLGQGTFAKVFYARNLTTSQAVAIKMINKDKVMKVGLMEQIKRGKLSEDAARKYFHQLISAVDYCHSRGVYHRDLKPENLLLDENENLKVSDFGLSALAESKRQDGLLHTTCGTPAYVAPEVLSRKGYDGAKADIWSCGVILFVLVAGYLPFHDTNLIEMYRKISRAEFRCPRIFSTELKDLLYKILDPDPSTRISISRIKRSAWYRKPVEVHAKKNEAETSENTCTGEGTTSGSTECSTSEGNQGPLSLPNLNAFDIISLSTGFNLSGFFEDKYGRREERFTTRQPVTTVFTKLKELSKRLKLKVKMKENGILKLASPKEGKKGVLELDAEILEVAPSLLLVELKKTNGDTMEYQKLVKEENKASTEGYCLALLRCGHRRLCKSTAPRSALHLPRPAGVEAELHPVSVGHMSMAAEMEQPLRSSMWGMIVWLCQGIHVHGQLDIEEEPRIGNGSIVENPASDLVKSESDRIKTFYQTVLSAIMVFVTAALASYKDMKTLYSTTSHNKARLSSLLVDEGLFIFMTFLCAVVLMMSEFFVYQYGHGRWGRVWCWVLTILVAVTGGMLIVADTILIVTNRSNMLLSVLGPVVLLVGAAVSAGAWMREEPSSELGSSNDAAMKVTFDLATVGTIVSFTLQGGIVFGYLKTPGSKQVKRDPPLDLAACYATSTLSLIAMMVCAMPLACRQHFFSRIRKSVAYHCIKKENVCIYKRPAQDRLKKETKITLKIITSRLNSLG